MGAKGHCKHGEFDLQKGCPQCIAERMGKKQIVKVQYLYESTGELSAREYSYYSEERLEVGDIVMVPIRDRFGEAKVSAIDVPESEIAAFKYKVKTICSGSKMQSQEKTLDQMEQEADESLAASEKQWEAEAEAEAFDNTKPMENIDTKRNICSACNLYGQFPTCMPDDDIVFGDGVGHDNVIQCANYEGEVAKPTETALAIPPGADVEVMSYHTEALKLQAYAEKRVIKTAEQVKLATDDLAIISNLKKAMEEKRKEYLNPLREQVEAINGTYKTLMEPILTADRITREKMLVYQHEQARIRQEQEEVNRLRIEAAQKEAALHGGEIFEPVELVEVKPEPAKSISTDMGTSGMTDHWIYEIVDLDAVPREYLVIDHVMLQSIAKKHHDRKPITGVRFYNKPFISVRPREIRVIQ